MIEAPVIQFPLHSRLETGDFNSRRLERRRLTEVTTKALAAGIIIVALAMILDGSFNNSTFESAAGGVLLGISIYTLLQKSA